MLAIGIVLIVAGAISFLSATAAYGDIAISMVFTAVVAVLAGVGLIVGNAKIKRLRK